jgi:hypothetical protein
MKTWAQGFAAGLDAAISAARVTLDEAVNDCAYREEHELTARVAANVLKGLEVAVKQIKLLEEL